MLQVAKRLGLSQATVSRVLNGKGHEFISPATRRRVLDAARDLGFDSGRVRHAELAGWHQVVALWIRNPDYSYYASIVHHLQRVAAQDDFAVVVCGYRDLSADAPFDPDRLPGWSTARWPVDGVIAVDCPHRQHAFIESRRGEGVPAMCGIGCDADPRIDNVVYDMNSPSYEIVKRMIDSGRRCVLHMTAYYSLVRVREARAAGYARAMEEAHLKTSTVVAPEETPAAAKRAFLDYVRTTDVVPDAVFCLHDVIALGVLQAARELGLSVPRDLAIAGYGGIHELDLIEAPIHTVRLPTDELADNAWKVFKQRLLTPSATPQRVIIQPQVNFRDHHGSADHAHPKPGAGRAVDMGVPTAPMPM
jgi:LacI family transcriptional regulator